MTLSLSHRSNPMTIETTDEELAELFHETYERLAPSFNYQTRKASAVPWSDVPPNNKALMTAVCHHVLAFLNTRPPVPDKQLTDVAERVEAELCATYSDRGFEDTARRGAFHIFAETLKARASLNTAGDDVIARVAVALEREFPECIDEGRMGFIQRLARAALKATHAEEKAK
jgi:hypothetical protein